MKEMNWAQYLTMIESAMGLPVPEQEIQQIVESLR